MYRHKEPEGVYKLLKWNNTGETRCGSVLVAKEATMKRLCDNHRIPLDPKKHTKQEYFFLHELNEQFFFIGSKEEEMSTMNAVNANRLRIKYKICTNPADQAPHPATYCETVSVEPDNIPIQDVSLT